MALSHPGQSDSLSSFLSTLQDDANPTTDTLLSDSHTSSSPSEILSVAPATTTTVDDALESEPWGLGLDDVSGTTPLYSSESLLEYFQVLDQEVHTISLEEQQQQTQFETMSKIVDWEAEQLQLLLGITGQGPDALFLGGDISDNTNNNNNNNSSSNHSTRMVIPEAAEIKRPDTKESFVHPGFYSLPTQSSNNSGTTVSTPSTSRKRSLQEIRSPSLWGFDTSANHLESSSANKRVMNQTIGSGSSSNSNRLNPFADATAAMEFRRHSLDSYPYHHHHSIYATPPKSPSSPLPHFQPSPLPHLQQSHGPGGGVPPGQPYIATTFASPQLSPYLHHALMARFQRSPAATAAQKATLTSSEVVQPASSSSSTSSSPSSSTQQHQQQLLQRKRRASKARVGGGGPHYNQYNPHDMSLFEYSVKDASMHLYHHHQNPLNAIPPPLQQKRPQAPQPPYLQAAAANMYPPLMSYSPKQSPRSQQPYQQQFPPQYLLTPPNSITNGNANSHGNTDSNHGNRSAPYRRNPGEVPASTLPPDHFVFREALLGMQQHQRGLSISHLGDAESLASAAAASRRSSEPAMFPSHYLSTQTADWMKTSTVAASSSSSSSSPVQSSSTGPKSTAATSITEVESESLSAAEAFAQSLSTVTTLDPAASKLIDQLRLQEYLRTIPPSSVATAKTPATATTSIAATATATTTTTTTMPMSSPPSTTATSIIASVAQY